MEEAPRLTVSPKLRELMAYDKLAGPVPRILILQSQYWLDAACINAAQGMGWEVRSVPVCMEGVLPRETIGELVTALGDFRPDFILSINFSGMDVQGLFARLFEDLAIPYVAWFVDDPRTILQGSGCYASAYTVALTWDQAYRCYLEEMGFPVVEYLPLAVDPSVFNAEPAETWDYPPSFVGNSMIDAAPWERQRVERDTELNAAIEEAFEAGRVTRENFGRGMNALIGEERCRRLDAERRRSAEIVLFVEGTRRLRHALVRALEPEGLEVHGDAGWREVTPNAKGPVNYTQDLAAFFRQCAVNVNTTSIQMPTTVNQRVFDCPAAGGFLLTDAQADLDDLFDGEREMVRYGSLEECVDLLRHYVRHSEARREITAKARKRTLGEHTYAHRLKRIVELVREGYGG